jgi:hypothetical protein
MEMMMNAFSMDNYPWGPITKISMERSFMVYDRDIIPPDMEAKIVVNLDHIIISDGFFNNKLIARKVMESLIVDLDEDDIDCI